VAIREIFLNLELLPRDMKKTESHLPIHFFWNQSNWILRLYLPPEEKIHSIVSKWESHLLPHHLETSQPRHLLINPFYLFSMWNFEGPTEVLHNFRH
jgi:hypothetical protein